MSLPTSTVIWFGGSKTLFLDFFLFFFWMVLWIFWTMLHQMILQKMVHTKKMSVFFLKKTYLTLGLRTWKGVSLEDNAKEKMKHYNQHFFLEHNANQKRENLDRRNKELMNERWNKPIVKLLCITPQKQGGIFAVAFFMVACFEWMFMLGWNAHIHLFLWMSGRALSCDGWRFLSHCLSSDSGFTLCN